MRTGDRFWGISQSEFFGNRDGSFRMITSNHFHLHASAAHLLDGRNNRLTRRVDNRGDAEKIKAFAEQFRGNFGCVVCHYLFGNRDDPLALDTELAGELQVAILIKVSMRCSN